MVRKIEKGVSAPRREEEGVGSGVLKDLSSKFKSKVGALFATMAVLGGVEEAEAETGNTDHIQYVGDIDDPTVNGRPHVDFSDQNNPTMVESAPFVSGTEVEINSQYSLRRKLGASNIMEVVELSTGSVVDSYAFPDEVRNVTPIGNGYIAVNAKNSTSHLYSFHISEIGSPQGISPIESNYQGFVTLAPLYMIVNPQTGEEVGAAFPNGVAFMFHLSDYVPNPDPDHLVKESIAYQKLGLNDPNYNGLYGGVDESGNCHLVSSRTTGEEYLYINPASEVMAPVELPVIQAPNSLELNLNNIGGEILDVEVTNVPENGKVVMELEGFEFEFSSAGNDQYVKGFSLNELIGIEKGEFEMIGVVKVLDGNGDVVKDENDNVVSAEVAVSVDLVAPTKVGFEIEGAVDGVLEVEEVPVKVRVDFLDRLKFGGLLVVVVMGEGMTVEKFRNMSVDDKVSYFKDRWEAGGAALNSVTTVEIGSSFVEVDLLNENLVIGLKLEDEAGNVSHMVDGYSVLLKEGQIMEPNLDMGSDILDMDSEVDAASDVDVDMGGDIDMNLDSGLQLPNKNQNSESKCSTVSFNSEMPNGRGWLEFFGLTMFLGLRRRKNKKNMSDSV